MGKKGTAIKPDYIYNDTPNLPELGETPVGITTNSMIKTFRRCPKQAEYKYVERLKPRSVSLPLKKGTWMHSLLEWYYKGKDWREKHEELTKEFNKLFDEEKERYGDLPGDCERLMKSYLWHYKREVWKVHEVEIVLETDLPDGSIYRGRIDLLIENEFGLWIVDHKNLRSLPDINFRILDTQSALYVWAALRMGISIQGFIWNYLKTKPPSIPEVVYNGTRLSKKAIDTDYPTYAKALKDSGLDPTPYEDKLKYLKSQRYRHGAPQTSSFFRRDIFEKPPDMLERVAREAFHTSRRMHSYPWHRTDSVERVPDRSCGYMCSYERLCTAELFGGNVNNMRRQQFVVGDPNDYYNDDKLPDKGEE